MRKNHGGCTQAKKNLRKVLIPSGLLFKTEINILNKKVKYPAALKFGVFQPSQRLGPDSGGGRAGLRRKNAYRTSRTFLFVDILGVARDLGATSALFAGPAHAAIQKGMFFSSLQAAGAPQGK